MHFVLRCITYKYWLHKRVTLEIVTPRKPPSFSASPWLTMFFSGWQFPMLPLVLSILILYWIFCDAWFKLISLSAKHFKRVLIVENLNPPTALKNVRTVVYDRKLAYFSTHHKLLLKIDKLIFSVSRLHIRRNK